MKNSFKLTKETEIQELKCKLCEYIHGPTGAKVLHIENDDPENAFCLGFQTYPKNSNGVAHILEHTVLCGSKKYPVKDPFFSMTRRSLNTFMNAFTGADFTLYPAASQVKKDFYQLLSVYADAVFHPNLKELSFLQEGHRYEFEKPDDSKSALEIKGIVYNEMKGDLTSPEGRLADEVQKQLFPDLPYGYNFGGDPKEIPNLTYDELKNFHAAHYHPSRCLFYFYGNLPIEEHLEFLEKEIFDGVDQLPPLAKLPKQPRFSKPVSNQIAYPIRESESAKDKTLISFGFLTCSISEQPEVFALQLLEILLMGTDAQPLKAALLESGLCKQALVSMEDDYSEIPLTITLKGCNPEHCQELEKILRDTLERIVKEGFKSEAIDNALHQLEFHKSEILGDNLPFGLVLFLRAGLLMQQGGNPEEALVIHSLFDKLRKQLEQNPAYLQQLIQKHFLDNPHRVTVTAIADPTLGKKEEAEERERISQVEKKLSEEERQEIVALAKRLSAYQTEDTNPECLPKIHLNDVPKYSVDYPLEQNGRLFTHETFTNQILYATLAWDLPPLTLDEIPTLRLLTLLMAQLGSGGHTWQQTQEHLLATTGGIGAAMNLNLQTKDFKEFTPYFYLQGKALYRNAKPLMQLFKDLATSINFNDEKRIKEVLDKHFVSLQASLHSNPLSWAASLASSGMDSASTIAYHFGGLAYFSHVKQLVNDFNASELIEKLSTLHQKIMMNGSPDLILTCDQEMLQKLEKENYFGALEMPGKNKLTWENTIAACNTKSQARSIASPIANTINCFKTHPYIHPDTPAIALAARLADNLTLHTRIREQGGAYTVGANNSSLSGTFMLYSARDPNIQSTLQAFDESLSVLREGKFSDEDLEEAKLEIIQGLDSPVAPGSRGAVAYSWQREGKSLAVRQAFRDRLLNATREDIIRVVKDMPINGNPNCTVVFAGKELIEREGLTLPVYHLED